jgi:hypothetical protein
MSGFVPHLEILPAAQREIWPQLAPIAGLGLVLYGGTAAALRLAHRHSVDFDFFTQERLDKNALARSLEFLSGAMIMQDHIDTLSVLVPVSSSKVKVSFFGEITTGRVGTPDRTADGVVQVAAPLDLLAHKLKVIHQRIQAKDYTDIAALLRSGQRLEDGLGGATSLFPSAFQPAEAARHLTCFDGGDLSTLSQSDRNVLTDAVAKLRRIPFMPVISKSLA